MFDGKDCNGWRTESEYDGQDRETLVRQIELPSGRVTSHTEYEYPAEDRKRTLDFGGCRDSNTPASVPTYLIETTYDSAGRVIEKTTSAPGQQKGMWCEDTPQPGRVVRQYDDQGHLVDQTYETNGIRNGHTSYSYDRFGNETGELWHHQQADGNSTVAGQEFVYEYDRNGNWTSKTTYDLDNNGNHRKVGTVEHQKFTYYRH